MFNGEKVYLKPNVMMEPLVDQWYAWSHLISPATFAMNLVERHLKIMESYARAPMVHAAAVKNPAMLGGPFIDLGGKKVLEVKQLIGKTRQRRSRPIEFQKAVVELDEMLRNEATGFSLEPLYEKIPPILKGYVELVYDLNNHPSFRFVEPLLYRSDHYDPSMQSMLLSLIEKDDRPFILSTPRLIGEDELHLEIPFADPRIDELFSMRTSPQTFSAIKGKLGIADRMDGQLARLFTAQPSPAYRSYKGKGARWRYFGHACILVETESTSILLDPVLSYTYESDISRYTYADLPEEIDYVLITHNHQDHILFETILQLRHRIKNVVVPRNGHGALQDPSLKLMMEAVGFKSVIELNEMDEIRTESGRIIGLPFFGEHADLNIRTKLAYWVEVDNHVLLFAADSCNIEPQVYRHLGRLLGGIDALFLGMECDGAPLSWLYGPLLTKPLERSKDQARRLAGSNYERGIEIINSFSPQEAYVYAMGQEPWLNYIMSKKYTEESNPIIASNQLIEDCRQRGVQAERLFGEKEILLGQAIGDRR